MLSSLNAITNILQITGQITENLWSHLGYWQELKLLEVMIRPKFVLVLVLTISN